MMSSPDLEHAKPKTRLQKIKDFNQVAIFVAILLGGGALGIQVLLNLVDGPSRQPGVAVLPVESGQGTTARPKVTYTKHFVAKLRDTYVFSLSSDVIDPFYRHPKSLERGMMRDDAPRGRYHPAGDAVNLIFVGPDGNGKVLFEQDVRINQYELSRDKEETPYSRHPFLLERNLYLVTTSDTNKDGFLNYEDAQTLYVSDYNGTNLKVVLENVESYVEVGSNTLLLTQRRDDGPVFFEYRLLDGQMQELILPQF